MNTQPRFRRPSLRQVLYRAHLGVALAAVCMAGLAVTVAGVLTLRAYASQNLELISRSMAYTAEAAVVFNDSNAAEEALRLIASGEEVSSAVLYDRHGHELATWRRPVGSPIDGLDWLAGRLIGQTNIQPIVRDGQVLGEIHLTGSGGRLLAFLIAGLAGILACLLLIALGLVHLSRRMVESIVGPLDELARVALVVRRDREFSHRVPSAPIAELDELGGNFNILLDELESWQTHLQSENASLEHQANHDSLTRLPNRAYFERRLNRALRELASRAERAAVLFIDTDHFKSVNDRLGHAAGDAVLVAVASRIRAQLRESDLVARLGGDEFAVLVAPLASDEVALRIADDIIHSMTEPIGLPDGTRVSTSLSIGIAFYPEHGETLETLLHRADTAMYHAKRHARGSRHLADAGDRPDPAEETSDDVEAPSS